MLNCPNKNFKSDPNQLKSDWQMLVDKYGESRAYEEYVKNGFDIPTPDITTVVVDPIIKAFQDKTYDSSFNLFQDLRESSPIRLSNEKLYAKKHKHVEATKIFAEVNKNHRLRARQLGLADQGIVSTRKHPKTGFAEVIIHDNRILDVLNKEKELIDRATEANEHLLPDAQRETLAPAENRADLDAKIAILRDFLPHVEEVIEDSSTEVMGTNIAQAEQGGKVIRINPELLGKDSIGHEFGHVFIDLIGGLNNPLIKSGLKFLEGTSLEQRIDRTYADKSQEVRKKELITQALGQEFSRQFDEAKLAKWEKWLLRFFRRVKEIVGIESADIRRLASRMLSDETLTRDEMVGEVSEDIYEQRQPADELREAASEVITRKIGIYSQTNKRGSIKALRSLRETLENDLKSAPEALLAFSRTAYNQISQVYKKADTFKKQLLEGKIDKVKTEELKRMHEYTQGYLDVLRDIRNKYVHERGRTDEKGKARRIVTLLDDAVSKIDYVEEFLRVEGAKNVENFLMSENLVNRIKAEYKDVAIKEFNTLNRDKLQQLKKENEYDHQLKQFVEKYVNDRLGDIEQQTRDLIQSEIKIAKGDISMAMSWAETILDSDDVLVSAYVKAVVEADHKAREDKVEHLTQLVNLKRELERVAPDTMFTNPRDYYDSLGFLEKDSKTGEFTQRLVGPYHSNFWSTFDTQKNKMGERIAELQNDTELDPRVRDREIAKATKEFREWKDLNAPLDKRAFREARDEFITDLYNYGVTNSDGVLVKITKDEFRDYHYYDGYRHLRKPSIEEIWSDNADAAELHNQWIIENTWEFRSIDNRWKNSQFDALEAIRNENPNDPRIKFYDFIIDSGKMSDDFSSPKDKLHNRLPSILKRASERTKSGQNVGDILDGIWKKTFAITAEETERGSMVTKELTTETGETKYFLPTHYTKPISESDQSYDLATIYQQRFESMADYSHKHQILPELELLKYFIENRKYFKRDSSKNRVIDGLFKREGLGDKYKLADFKDSNLMRQLDHWNKSMLYGMREVDEGKLFWGKVDAGKLANTINKYTALNMLGLNFVQGTANYLLGETMQIVEAFAGEHYTMSDYSKAANMYNSRLMGIIGDIGSRRPINIINLLNERFDTISDYRSGSLRQSNRFRRLMNSNSLFFNSHAGEHMMQTKVMIAMLHKLTPLDKDGNVVKDEQGRPLKSMFYAFKSAVDKDGNHLGKLEMNPNVANFSQKDQIAFGMRVKRILSRMHGEYSDLGRVAMQRYALGRMAYMFRKFVVQGYKRRWEKGYRDPELKQRKLELIAERKKLSRDDTQKRQEIDSELRKLNLQLYQPKYNELGDFFSEGNYVTTGRFMKQYINDLGSLQFTLMSENWADLRPHEKANLKRMIGDVFFMLTAMVLGGLFMAKGKDDDEDRWIWGFLSYQMLRWKAELMFFTPKIDEAMSILRSPAASVSVLENVIKISGQLFDPMAVYQTGPHKGKPKLHRLFENMIPVHRQIYRMRDIDTQIPWFRQNLFTEQLFSKSVEEEDSQLDEFREYYGF